MKPRSALIESQSAAREQHRRGHAFRVSVFAELQCVCLIGASVRRRHVSSFRCEVSAPTTRLVHLARAVRELPDTVEATAVLAELLGLIADLEQLRLIQSGTWWVGAKNPR